MSTQNPSTNTQASTGVGNNASAVTVASVLSQEELKALVGLEALKYVKAGDIIGVGTGSTVNHFIKALGANEALLKGLKGAVSSSEATTALLRELGISVLDASLVDGLSIYIDGADEIDHGGYMIKGGGAALTREKIVASLAKSFICIADESKLVNTLGRFPLPVEIIPMAATQLMHRFEELGGSAKLRLKGGAPLVTDNGQHILDVSGLQIKEPMAFESLVSQWAGVVTVGVFAYQQATLCLLATTQGVKTLKFNEVLGSRAGD
jgi:ribose 5-phosphate isomerase A